MVGISGYTDCPRLLVRTSGNDIARAGILLVVNVQMIDC